MEPPTTVLAPEVPQEDTTHRVWRIIAPIMLILAGLAAYSDSFTGSFIFDDDAALVDNATIREPGNIRKVLSPPGGGRTVQGRPILNLSLAINFAVSELKVWSYHVLNLIIHILAGLTLYGLVRRTSLLPRFAGRFAASATPLAWIVAILWLLHPLQTGSVTYIIQRAESLMGLWFFLTFYAFVRGAKSPHRRLWYALSVLACAAGMATKEVTVVAPILLLLYDRIFLSSSFRRTLGDRWKYYVSMVIPYGLLAGLVYGTLVEGMGNRGSTAGFNMAELSPLPYFMTQCKYVLLYLRLAFWPHPLILDYGWPGYGMPIVTFWEFLPYAAGILALLAATAVAFRYVPWLGFLGAWFFLILAPTSTVLVIVTEPVAEHRMYLPLAAWAVLVVIGGYLGALKLSVRIPEAIRRRLRWPLPLAGVTVLWAAALGTATFFRNLDYKTVESIWIDTVQKRPGSARGHFNLGTAVDNLGRKEEAIEHYRDALRIRPDYYEALVNMGNALSALERHKEAVQYFQVAIQVSPGNFTAHQNLAITYLAMERNAEALAEAHTAIELEPTSPVARNTLGNILFACNQPEAALDAFKEVLRLDPHFYDNNPGANSNLGDLCNSIGRYEEAVELLHKALRLVPDFPEAYFNLGNAKKGMGKPEEAIEHYRTAIRLRPEYAEAHNNLGNVLASLGRNEEAAAEFRRAINIQKDFPEAYNNLANLLLDIGLYEQAIVRYSEAIRLKQDYANAYNGRANAYCHLGRYDEAWRDIASCRKHGGVPNPAFLRQLSLLSGRSEEIPDSQPNSQPDSPPGSQPASRPGE